MVAVTGVQPNTQLQATRSAARRERLNRIVRCALRGTRTG